MPTTTNSGPENPVPTGKLTAVPNDPVPSPGRIETLPEPTLATARSSFPSLSKSPTAIERGEAPTAKLTGGANDPVPSPIRLGAG